MSERARVVCFNDEMGKRILGKNVGEKDLHHPERVRVLFEDRTPCALLSVCGLLIPRAPSAIRCTLHSNVGLLLMIC